MKKRPTCFLFIFALLGSIFTCKGIINLSWPFFILSIILIFLFACFSKNTLIKALLINCFVFILISFLASQKIQSYKDLQEQIPKKENLFIGEIVSSWPHIDSTQVTKIKISSIGDKKIAPINMTLRIKGAAAALSYKAGDTIAIKTKAYVFKKPRSPFHFDGFNYGLANNLHASATIKRSGNIFIQKGNQRYFSHLRKKLRDTLLTTLTPFESSLLLALSIGETNLFDKEQREIFAGIGSQHLLAVSGLQVTLIAFILTFFLIPLFSFALPLRYKPHAFKVSALLVIAFLWVFVGLCHFPKSALRAFLMASFLLLPHFIKRNLDSFDALFASGLLILVLDPISACDMGFLLSYAAVFSIMITIKFSYPLLSRVKSISLLSFVILSALVISCAAFLATLPIVSTFSNHIAPTGFLTNAILTPLASILQIPSLLFTFIGSIINSPLLLKMACFFATLIQLLADFLADNLAYKLYLPNFSPLPLFLFLLGPLIIFWTAMKKNKAAILIGLCWLLIPISGSIFFKKESLKVIAMPVGHGDATLFKFPNKQSMLIDAGGSAYSNYDPGKEIVLETLLLHRVKKLDVLAITHPDADHILGAFAIINAIKIEEIWMGGIKENNSLYNRLKTLAQKKGIKIYGAHRLFGSHNFGEVEVQVIAPHLKLDEISYEDLGTNDNSLVLRIKYGKHKLLWPGDIEREGERLLVNDNINLQADIIKAPHHGSNTSSSLFFLEKIKPKYVLFYTGETNRFSFPKKEIVKRYKKMGAKIFDTKIHGQIVIDIDKHNLSFETFTSDEE